MHLHNNGCPTPRDFLRGGTTNLARLVTRHRRESYILLSVAHADQPAPLLQRRISSLHHHQLLPKKTPARHSAESRSVSRSLGRGAPPSPFRDRRLRGHARARPFVVQRTGARRSFGGDESHQTVLRSASVQKTSHRRRPAPVHAVECGAHRRPLLATPLL